MKHTSALIAVLLASAAHAQVTHELQVEDDEFNPDNLTINAGDHVHIFWDNSVVNDHTFTQVEQSVWNVNGSVPLAGGYDLGVGTADPGTDFTITPSATVWYVCSFHASMGMKGVITVLGGNGIEEATEQEQFLLAPNPANGIVSLISPMAGPLMVQLYDATGRRSGEMQLISGRSFDTQGLGEGVYVLMIRSMEGALLSRQRLVVGG